jgi:hypothetical protein
MNRIISAILYSAVVMLLANCTETDFKKVTLPTTAISGEYVVALNLAALDITDEQHIRVFNTTFSTDSLWVEDADFFETQVRVKWNGDHTFGVSNGVDIWSGIDVDINGEVFPANDSIHVEWTYKQVDIGLGPEDYVVTADGVLYNGITN